MCTFCQSKRVSLAPLIWQWAWPLALSEDLFVQFVQKSEQEAEPHGHRLLTQTSVDESGAWVFSLLASA